MTHHEFSPSALERIRICPASYEMQKGIAEQESQYAIEGSMLHEKVATRSTDNLNAEQTQMVQKCLDFLDSVTKSGDTVHIEQLVSIKDIDDKELSYGTADVIIIHVDGSLSVIDWKFGYTPVKSASQNIQMATYSLGAMQKFNASNCTCYVFQPRIYKTTKHTFTNQAAILGNIKSIIAKATGNTMIFNATEQSCRYCKARLQCPAFRCKYQRLLASKDDYDLSDTITLEKLYDDSSVLKTFIKDIETRVKKIIESTGACGKYKFDIKDGSRKIEDLNSLYGIIKDLITPNEFNQICSVSLTKLESLYSDKLIAEATAKGEKLTKKLAKERCFELVKPLVSRGTPTKTIIEVA